MLKLSYKKGTGRKAITDKNGKTTIFDFYGPKVVNNTRGEPHPRLTHDTDPDAPDPGRPPPGRDAHRGRAG